MKRKPNPKPKRPSPTLQTTAQQLEAERLAQLTVNTIEQLCQKHLLSDPNGVRSDLAEAIMRGLCGGLAKLVVSCGCGVSNDPSIKNGSHDYQRSLGQRFAQHLADECRMKFESLRGGTEGGNSE